MNKRIAIIGTVGLPSKYGGFETLTEYLTRYLSNSFDITVYCSSKVYSNKLEYYNNAKLEYINLNANGIQSIPYDIISIIKAMRYADTLLILGVSGALIIPLIKRLSNKKIVVNIDGLEWKREKWNIYARWFLKLSEKVAVKSADIIVADNEVIKNYIINEYGKKSELIAYGADHVKRISLSSSILDKYKFLKNKYLFTVCRIEPENNIHIILEAVSKQTKFSLVIVGNWNASQYGQKLRKLYQKIKNIYLLDPIYNQNILNELRSNCYIYLHGHSAGGTNPSLVEAMALKLPIIAYGINYNRETTDNKAMYFLNSNELYEIIENINDSKLYEIACKMENLAIKRYKWKIISEQYARIL